MALTTGLRLGAYEIVSLIGAGGMGEVYRARDLKLGREVALKVLPESFATDPDRLARFRREAQVLASLNHPNIGHIYGLEESGGVPVLALELVEGPTLADRIAQGPIPLDETLPIARQIADALEAAHESGIIHRDLKPANIKLRDDGTVKLLDFGLAKLTESPSPSGVGPALLTQSPTITTPAMMTGVGMILGTAAYMSPEQARGKTVDKRADIWAFGCVLYEMLSGLRPFDAEDVSMTLASVMMKEPDWSALGADVPAHVRTVVKRCLEKDRKRRLSDIAVAQFLINEPPAPVAVEATSAEVVVPPEPMRLRLTRLVTLGVVAILALAAAVATTWWVLRSDAQQPVRFTIVPPSAQPLTIHGFQRDIAITPDGRHIVYRVGPAGVVGTQLAVRSLDQLDARILTGITSIRSPFVSPDGHWIGFFEGTTGGALKKVSIQGGPPIEVCKYSGNPLEGSWGPDDTIIFATNERSTGLMSVPAAGGEPKTLTKPDTGHGEADHLMPFILPGGRAVLFTIIMQGQPIDTAQIAVLDLMTGHKKVLIRGGSDARYVETGHLVYAVAGTLRAIRFDPKRLELAGDPIPLVENVTMSGITGTADFALSQSGTLVYVAGGIEGNLGQRSLAWVSRQGHEEPIRAPQRVYTIPRISPDGTRVALDIRDQENDIWVWDLKRETLTRLTFDPGVEQFPVWTPDSRRIFFSSSRDGVQNVYWQAADNTGTIERLTTSPNAQIPLSVSPDGTRLVFMEISPKTNQDIGMLTLGDAKKREVSALLQTTFTEANAEISPDGRWIAYQSSESGSFQIYVRPFPNVDAGRWQISTVGGTRPLWARSGREVFYYDSQANALMAVAVQTTGTMFSAGNPSKLFGAASYFWANNARAYDVSADGKRFLMIKLTSLSGQSSTAPPPSLVVVEHWTEELKARVGTK